MSSEPPAASGTDRSDYLPDFCEPRAVLAVVLVSALLAIVLALAQHGARDDFLVALARTSGYLLWTGLLCALVLCKSRPWLARHSLRASSIVALSLVVGTVALVSEATYQARTRLGRRARSAVGYFPARALEVPAAQRGHRGDRRSARVAVLPHCARMAP